MRMNTRTLRGPLTGVQRYAQEMFDRLGSVLSPVEPGSISLGVRGHAWEQFILPRLVGDELLWSPANCGPLELKRQIVTIHDLSPLDHPEWMSRKYSAWYQFMIPRLAERVATIIADSAYTKSRIIERCRIPDDKVTVVHLGVSSKFAPAPPEAIRLLMEKLGLAGRRYFLIVGSIEPRKNLARVISAWRTAVSRLDEDIVLVVAGAVGDSKIFADQALGALPERVLLVGRVSDADLPTLYSGALAAIYLSLYEGFGLPPLEAMACGVATLSSATTSVPEVVGDAGMLVDPLNIGEIAEAMVQLASDSRLCATFSELGLKRASRFNWDETAATTLKILRTY